MNIRLFKDIIEYFNEKDVFVFNDTKVFPARLYGNKEKTGAEIEVFLLRELNRENFAVRQHLRYVEKFSRPESYTALSYEDTLLMGEELAPLIVPDGDDPKVGPL